MSGHPLARLSALLLVLTLAACAAYQAQHARLPSRERAELPDDPRITSLRGEADALKAELARQGRYACCVEPACTECLLKYGECHCREAVRKEGPCCGECTEAWIEGKGVVEGITAWELLERKKHVLDEVNRKGGGEEKQKQDHQHQHDYH